MEATATLVGEETQEDELQIDLPSPFEFVECIECTHKDHNGKPWGLRSYMFFHFKDGLFAYCKHHGEMRQEALEAVGGVLVLDTRDSLIENRLKES